MSPTWTRIPMSLLFWSSKPSFVIISFFFWRVLFVTNFNWECYWQQILSFSLSESVFTFFSFLKDIFLPNIVCSWQFSFSTWKMLCNLLKWFQKRYICHLNWFSPISNAPFLCAFKIFSLFFFFQKFNYELFWWCGFLHIYPILDILFFLIFWLMFFPKLGIFHYFFGQFFSSHSFSSLLLGV